MAEVGEEAPSDKDIPDVDHCSVDCDCKMEEEEEEDWNRSSVMVLVFE